MAYTTGFRAKGQCDLSDGWFTNSSPPIFVGGIVLTIYERLHSMKKLIVSAILISLTLATSAHAGRCTYPSDTASDGSRCRDRASTVRTGGR